MPVTFIDALIVVAEPYGIERSDALRGREAFYLAGRSNLVVLEDGADMVIAVCLDEEGKLSASKIAASCLRANTQGAQTGAARLAIDPDLGLVLIEYLPISQMDEARFIDRVSAFLAYAEFWEMEGLPALIAGLYQSRAPEVGMIRI